MAVLGFSPPFLLGTARVPAEADCNFMSLFSFWLCSGGRFDTYDHDDVSVFVLFGHAVQFALHCLLCWWKPLLVEARGLCEQ